VLAEYGVAPDRVRITLSAQSYNTVFRVLDSGFDAALRIGPGERIHAEETEAVEAQWMRSLRASGTVSPPEVFDAVDGRPAVRRSRPGVPGERVCMLFGWVRGRPLSEVMSSERAERAGTVAALLHEHAAATERNAPLPVLVADRVLYWRLEDRLAEAGTSSSTLISEAHDRAQQHVAQLWARPPHRPHLLHGDLTPYNLMVEGRTGALVPIDFQDLIWGFEVQDLAITLSSFGRFDDPDDLRARFHAGYQDVRPWPDFDPAMLAALVGARRLQQLNLALTLRRPGLDVYVPRIVELIKAWMAQPDGGLS